ncbi:MAG: HAMP domain-containing histidine kinase [Bacteroidetes bacterium]|nr:HAMP domain-containing histidine kinase [Bacteroidota bacterium]
MKKYENSIILIVGLCLLFGVGVLTVTLRGLGQRSSNGVLFHESEQNYASIQEGVSSIFYSTIKKMLNTCKDIEYQLSYQTSENNRVLFAFLEKCTKEEDYTIDVIDTNGTLVAWVGDAVRDSYDSQTQIDTTMTLVEKNGMVYLALTMPIKEKNVILVLYKCLNAAHRVPAIKTMFQEELENNIGISGRVIKNTSEALPSEYYVPLTFSNNRVLGYIAFDKQGLAQYEGKTFSTFDAIRKWGIFFLCVYVIGVGWVLLSKYRKRWIVLTGKIALLWVIRYACIYFEIPNSLFELKLFTPYFYGSSFGSGLASSLGDLLFTTIVLLVSIIILGREIKPRGAGLFSLSTQTYSKSVIGIILGVLFAFHLLLIHGYGASIRSFVYDSTVDLFFSSAVFPSFESMILIFSTIFLSIALVYSSNVIFTIQWVFVEHTVPVPYWRRVFIVALVATAGIVVFLLFVNEQKTPFWIWYFLFFFFLSTQYLHTVKQWKLFRSSEYCFWVCTVIAAYVLCLPILYRYSVSKEYERYESLAKELAQPIDVRMQLLVADVLSSIRQNFIHVLRQHKYSTYDLLAYRLWSFTQASKTNVQGGLYYYDENGEERDQFVIGMSSYEIREVLRLLFEHEEEVSQTITIQQNQKSIPYYGVWFTLRDANERIQGTVACILSPYKTSTVSTITPLVDALPLSYLITRDISVVEYNSGRIISTIGTVKNIPVVLPDSILSAVNTGLQSSWYSLSSHEQKMSGFFVVAKGEKHKIVGILVGLPSTGVLLFNCVKLLFMFALVALIFITPALLQKISLRAILYGFRTKLFVGILIVAILPLGFLVFYTQSISHDMLQQLIQASLMRDLDALERRIGSYVEDEEDFINGVDDDFCKALAVESGIDFTVFQNMYVQASSTPELYRTGILGNRLNGVLYAQILSGGSMSIFRQEVVRGTNVVAGYKGIRIGGKPVGIIRITTLGQYPELEIEIIRKNATLLSFYAVVCIIVLFTAGVVTVTVAKPIRVLQDATQRLSTGELNYEIVARFKNEFDELITSFNSMIRELRHHREEAEKVERERAWREMAKQVAHEIRNPLTPMKLSVQHLVQVFKDKVPEREDILKNIAQSLIEQIESLSRIASEFSSFGKMPTFQYEKVNLTTIVQQAVQVFASMQTIQFQVFVPPTLVEILADPEHLQRAFINIIKNAVQVLEQGGTITVTVSLDEQSSRVQIRDTGPGIPPEHISKIFEPNFSTKTEGMGLGLAIARRIIEEMGGTIECESVVGHGTTFTITFPK